MSLFDPALTADELNPLFENLTVEHFINSGGQGEIWKVKNENELGWALKIYPLEYCRPIRVEREIEAFQNLDSEYIVKLYDHGDVNIRNKDCLYYCMDFCSGESIKDRINTGQPLNNDELTDLILQVSSALQSLWANRIVHRDIKPDNVLITNDLFVLIDLGCARHLEKITVTQNGRTMGTLGYMSPEQARCRKGLTIRSDFFSLGILAYEAATCVHPFSKRQDLISNSDPKPIQEIVNIPDKLARCIHSLLNKSTIERPNSKEEIESFLN